MLVQGSDAESGVHCCVHWCLRRSGRGGVVTALQVRTGLIHRGQTRAKGEGLLGLLGSLLLGSLLKQFLKAGIVLARFG